MNRKHNSRIINITSIAGIVFFSIILGLLTPSLKIYANEDIYTYNDDGDTVIITGLKKGAAKLIENPVIPSEIGGKPVTEISKQAFFSHRFKGTLTLPDSLTTIGIHAFLNNSELTGDLTIPENVTSIGADAFSVCEGLTGTLTLPASLQTVGSYSFFACKFSTIVNNSNLTIPAIFVLGGSDSYYLDALGNKVTNEDNFGSGTYKRVDEPVQSVSFASDTIDIAIGETAAPSVKISPSDATIKTLSWSSDTPSVATVNENGVITAVSAGTAQITVETFDGGLTAKCNVNVSAKSVPVSAVSLNKDRATLNTGDTLQLTANINPGNADNKGLTWSSNNQSVATVISTGLVKGVKSGTAIITVKTDDGGKTDTCEITVKAPVAQVTGTDKEVIYTFNDDGDTVIITGLKESVSTPLENSVIPSKIGGKPVTGISKQAFYYHKFKGTLTLPDSLTTIGINAFVDNTEITGDLTIPKNVTNIGANAFSICEGLTGTLTLPASLQTVGSNAFFGCNFSTIVNNSNLTIPACYVLGGSNDYYVDSHGNKVTNQDNFRSGTYKRVKNSTRIVSLVSLNKYRETINAGTTLQLTATISQGNAYGKGVTWSSNNESIATVSSKGLVKGVKSGTTYINATAVNGKKATCKVTVKANSVKVTGIKLNKKSASIMKGKTLMLKATVSPSRASNKNVTWKSSNTKVAIVSNKGVVTAIKAGTATITATTKDGNKKATCKITVNEITSVKFDKNNYSVKKGTATQLKITFNPKTPSNKEVTYKSSNNRIAKIDKNGKVTGVKKGIVTITVTTKDGKKTAKCKVTVK